MPKYFDAHCHLQNATDIPGVLSRAESVGCAGCVCNATRPSDWDAVLEIGRAWSCVRCAIGVHPWYIGECSANWDVVFRQTLMTDKKIMVGEIGLDINHPDITAQERIMGTQMEIAHELSRPVWIHCVGAWDRVLHIMKSVGAHRPPVRIMHAFAGTPQILHQLMRYDDVYVSYSPMILDAHRTKLIDTVRTTPLNRILVESDGSDPAVVTDVVARIAEIHGIDTDTVANTVFKNIGGILSI